MLNSDDIIIRPFNSQKEAFEYCLLASRMMLPDQDPITAATNWDRFTRQYPGFRWEQRRGAFFKEALLGGLAISEGILCAGNARLTTGCIGNVVTDTIYQRQGVATKLMQDALEYAKERKYSLLLLDGTPRFYPRFGYTQVIDYREYDIERVFIEALKPSPYSIRQAKLSDAQTLLDLYNRHFGTFIGAFHRTLEKQEHFLKIRLPQEITLLVFDAHEQPRGFLTFSNRNDVFRAIEVAADDWDACVALLQEQSARLTIERDPTPIVRWILPPDSTTYHLLNDYRSDRDLKGDWLIHTHIYNRPGSGWMARLASVKAFLQAMIPQWQLQIQGLVFPEIAGMTLVLDNKRNSIALKGGTLEWVDTEQGFPEAIISGDVMMQLVFGYRNVDWAIRQPGQSIPTVLKPLFEMLFLYNRGWISHSDSF